jgi:putative ABC transport system substrate-binding protein
MKRREFITLVGGAASAWPFGARGQQPSLPVVGFLHPGSREAYAHAAAAFERGLAESGYAVGQNVLVEYRWAGTQNDLLPALAMDLARRNVDVIAALGTVAAARAANEAAKTTPIVFAIVTDPVAAGLVTSLNQPGGNFTGVSWVNLAQEAKKLDVMHQVLPASASIAFLVNRANLNVQVFLKEVQDTALLLGRKVHIVSASTDQELEVTFASLAELGIGGVVICADVLFGSRREKIASLALQHGVASIYGLREFAVAGGLMSYGGSIVEGFHQCGIYVGKILKGNKPADLPVFQASKLELVINLQTAKALGLKIPQPILARADEVIE